MRLIARRIDAPSKSSRVGSPSNAKPTATRPRIYHIQRMCLFLPVPYSKLYTSYMIIVSGMDCHNISLMAIYDTHYVTVPSGRIPAVVVASTRAASRPRALAAAMTFARAIAPARPRAIITIVVLVAVAVALATSSPSAGAFRVTPGAADAGDALATRARTVTRAREGYGTAAVNKGVVDGCVVVGCG